MKFSEFARAYQARFRAAVDGWDIEALERVAEIFAAARARGGTILIAGNGGSASIANHAECDASKGTHVAGVPPLNSRSLTANISVLTAIANDHGYAEIFERQVDYYGKPGDVLVLVSSKGSSPNVVAACKAAQERGIITVAMVGFDGGALKGLADEVVHVPADDYGIVEDMHQACFHVITQFLKTQAAK